MLAAFYAKRPGSDRTENALGEGVRFFTVSVCRRSGAGLLAVPNASPYERGKDDVRLDLVVRRAREAGAALAYANMTGGQDELVFDGDSILVRAAGAPLARGPQFEEALVVADLDLPAAPAGEVPGDQPVDAEDGTVITIKRVTLPDAGAAPADGRRIRGGRSGRGCPIRPRCTRRWSPGSGTT